MSLGGKLKSFMTGAFQGASQGLPQAVDVFTAGQERRQQKSQFDQKFQQQQTADFLAQIQGAETPEELNSLEAGFREMDNISSDVMGRLTSTFQGRRSGFAAEKIREEELLVRDKKIFEDQLLATTESQRTTALLDTLRQSILRLGTHKPELAAEAFEALEMPKMKKYLQIIVDAKFDPRVIGDLPDPILIAQEAEKLRTANPGLSYEDSLTRARRGIVGAGTGANNLMSESEVQRVTAELAGLSLDAAEFRLNEIAPFMPPYQKRKVLEDKKKESVDSGTFIESLVNALGLGVGTYSAKGIAAITAQGAGSKYVKMLEGSGIRPGVSQTVGPSSSLKLPTTTSQYLKGVSSRTPGFFKGTAAGVAMGVGEAVIPDKERTVGGTILGHAVGGAAAGSTVGPWGTFAGGVGGAFLGAYREREALINALSDPFGQTPTSIQLKEALGR